MKKLMYIFMTLLMVAVPALAAEQAEEQKTLDSAAKPVTTGGLLKAGAGTPNVVVREVIGRGPNRDEAIQDGLYRAIEQVRGVKVGSGRYAFGFSGTGAGVDTSGQGRSRIEFDSVNVATEGTLNTTEIGGFIKGYDVIEENQVDQETYQVKLKVEVYDYGTRGQTQRVKIALMPAKTMQTEYSFLNVRISGDTLSQLFTQKLAQGLTQTNKFAVLDRESIRDFARERNTLVSFDAPFEEQAKLAETIGADYLLVGTITQAKIERIDTYLEVANYTKREFKARFNFDYRLVDSATKQITLASSVQKYLENEQVRKLADEQNPNEWDPAQVRDAFLSLVANDIIEAIIDRVYPVKVAAVLGDGRIVLNQGGDKMAKGMQFDIYSEGQEIIDTDTNESLGKVESYIATIEVQSVEDNMSMARVVKGDISNITKGLVCRIKEGKKAPAVGAKPDIKKTEGGGIKLPFD